MKLSHYDRTLIHALGVASRPPLIDNPSSHHMLVSIIEVCVDRVAHNPHAQLEPLIAAARLAHPDPKRHRATVHHIAAAMNEFDRWALGAHWDAARGVK